MTRKHLYLAAAALAGAVVAYFCTTTEAQASDDATPTVTGNVTGGDPIIVSGTFGYALPATIPTLRR